MTVKMTVNELAHLTETSNPLLACVLRALVDYVEEDLGEIVLEIPADLLNLTTT